MERMGRLRRPLSPAAGLCLHPAGCLNAQQVQAPGQRAGGEIAEHQPAVAGSTLCMQHGALLVETAERGRQAEQIMRESVKVQCLADRWHHGAESEKLQRQDPLGLLADPYLSEAARSPGPGTAEDRADARGRVLQVRGGVTVE